jgi:hypothetical protein
MAEQIDVTEAFHADEHEGACCSRIGINREVRDVMPDLDDYIGSRRQSAVMEEANA